MRSIAIAAMAITCMILASCNTTDALTPQVDVGGGLQPSTPVTRADVIRMANQPEPTATTSYSASRPAGRPQNSLQAQAQAMAAGENTAPMRPGPGTPPQTLDQQAARQPGATLQQPQAEAVRSPVAEQQSQPRQPPAAAQTAALSPDQSATGSIRFLPIIGAPVQAVTPLSRQLGAEARAKGLAIKASGDTSSQHILKGYFSAFGDRGKVTITYVWDVLDANGARLHRIQGQENIPSTATDPWAGVPASVMQQIATKTIDIYTDWLRTQAG